MKIKLTLLIIFFLVLNNVYAERIEVTGGGGGGGSTYTAGGTLLNLTGTAFSVKEGTLTTTKGCKYVTGTGLVCDQDYLITETDPLSATKALNNLASVAINTSLISDTAATDDLGTEAIYWRKLYLGSDISFEGAADDTYQTTLTAVDTTLSDKSINIPNASGTMAVSATAPMTVSALGDIGVTVAKDIVAGVGLSGGEDNVLPGADADTTLTFDATELGALTWSDNSLASIAWTWNLSGTDDTVTFGSDLVTFSNSLTVATGKNIKLGTTQWNSGDSIDGTKIANADLGEIGVSSGVWSVENATVIGKLLTGYSSGAGTVATTDTILQAFNKLNGNDATNANLTGEVTSVGNAATIADSVAVSSWNLTTPTITTSLTTSTPTTLTAAELDRLDGLAGVIVTDTTACTEIDGNGLTITTGTLNFDGGDAPGGELGGTWATPTIDDSVAVTSWALTTPTITTSAAWNADPADTGAIRLSNADYIWAEASPAGTDISVIGVDATEIIQIGASGASGVTITPTVTITGDLTVNGDDIQLGATGVKITDDTDGAITFLGSSAGADENLRINLDDTANVIVMDSTTAATELDWLGTSGSGALFGLGSAGVLFSDDADGALTITGRGTGADENLIINLDDTANTIDFSSGTAATIAQFTGLSLSTTAAGDSYFNEQVAIGQTSAEYLLDILGADNTTIMRIKNNANQAATTAADIFISFDSTTGVEGSIAGTAVAGVIAFNTATLSHFSQLIDRDKAQPNMLLEVIDGKPEFGEGASPKEQLFKTRICRTKKSQAAMGTYGGTDIYGHDFVLSAGTGFVFVKNTGRNIKIGDLFYSSDSAGLVEFQNDTIIHNYTIAKATESIKWKWGEKQRLISCILLGG